MTGDPQEPDWESISVFGVTNETADVNSPVNRIMEE